MFTRINNVRLVAVGLAVILLGLSACQRSRYPVGNIKDPSDAPPYTQGADKDPVVQVK